MKITLFIYLVIFTASTSSLDNAAAGKTDTSKNNDPQISPHHETLAIANHLTQPIQEPSNVRQYTEGGGVIQKDQSDTENKVAKAEINKGVAESGAEGENKTSSSPAKSNIAARKGVNGEGPPSTPSGGQVSKSSDSTTSQKPTPNIIPELSNSTHTESPKNSTTDATVKPPKNDSVSVTTSPKKPLILYSVADDSHRTEGLSRLSKAPTANAHPNLVIPITITVFALPLFAVLGYYALKHGREAWKNRHYRRMDFLLDGMYND